MEQLVARWAHNPKVAGSSPAPATMKTPSYLTVRYLGVSSFVVGTVLWAESVLLST